MKTKETIYETYSKRICSICKNKEICQEDLRIKIDKSIKCERYESTFIPREVDSIMHGCKW